MTIQPPAVVTTQRTDAKKCSLRRLVRRSLLSWLVAYRSPGPDMSRRTLPCSVDLFSFASSLVSGYCYLPAHSPPWATLFVALYANSVPMNASAVAVSIN
jgi:hypothetical protein